MRFENLVEQVATYSNATQRFTFTTTVPGRLAFAAISAEIGERLFYYAITADKSQWELGAATWNGSTYLQRADVIRSSSSDSAVNFLADVVVSLVQPGHSMLVVDNAGFGNPAIVGGAFAMAGGYDAQAFGASATALGSASRVGASGAPVQSGTAIGRSAQCLHTGATAVGEGAITFMPYAIHGQRSIIWSGGGVTFGLENSDLSASSGDRPLMPLNSYLAIDCMVVARSNTANVFAARITGLLKRGSSGDATIIGTPIVSEIAKSAGVTVSATLAVRTGGEFALRCTGVAGQDWFWSGSFDGVWV